MSIDKLKLIQQTREKTAVISHHRIYQLIRSSYGLKNAAATFHRVMDVILLIVKWKYALVYLDDVVTFSKTPKDHVGQQTSVLRLLKDAGISLTLKMLAFFMT